MKQLIMLLAMGTLGLTLTSCGSVFYDDGYYDEGGIGFFGGGWGHGHGHGGGGHFHSGGGYAHGGGGHGGHR